MTAGSPPEAEEADIKNPRKADTDEDLAVILLNVGDHGADPEVMTEGQEADLEIEEVGTWGCTV